MTLPSVSRNPASTDNVMSVREIPSVSATGDIRESCVRRTLMTVYCLTEIALVRMMGFVLTRWIDSLVIAQILVS